MGNSGEHILGEEAKSMKPVWKGYITFGLVTIPIKLISAIESKTTGFRLLDKRDKTPVRYVRWNPKKERQVPWDEVVKGMEISKDEYIILEKEELDKLKPEKTDTIEVAEFVDAQQLDPIYFNKHYYALPEEKILQAYNILSKHMHTSHDGSASLALYMHRFEQGKISPRDRILIVNTGRGI